MESATENVHLDMFLHIKEKDDILSTDEKHGDVFARVARLDRILSAFMNSPFAREMAKVPRVRGTLVKTNVIKKNPNYKAVAKLYEFFHHYQDIGYAIKVEEQSPDISDTFQRDIFHGVMFNYIILKNYLEDEKSREVPTAAPAKRRVLKPKFIKEIIEELTEDYDLPDIEIRKVLIEELTKEQLLLEEEAERRRLVEEQEQRKREEEERIRQEKEAEKERIRKEKEAEAERIRLEKEEEQKKIRAERMAQEAEDRRRSKIFAEEITYFKEHLPEKLAAREAALERLRKAQLEMEEATRLLEEAKQRNTEAELREQKRKQEEQERQRLEEEERLRREAEVKEQLRQEQDAKDTEATGIYLDELVTFKNELEDRIRLRETERQRLEQEKRLREEERQRRIGAARY